MNSDPSTCHLFSILDLNLFLFYLDVLMRSTLPFFS